VLGNGGGQLQKLDASGNLVPFVLLNNFTAVYAFTGHDDTGLMNGTPGVQNVFVSAGAYCYMSSGSGFYLISGARYVYAYATGAGDIAYHYDGSGASALVISGVAYSFMQGTDGGQSFFNEAAGFRFNYGIARHMGDVAYFYDSPGNDVFVGGAGGSYMYAANPNGTLGEFDWAQGFGLIFAESFVGGTDYAYDYDPAHNILAGFHRLA